MPEVELVRAVHACRQCGWLWDTPRLYGPFPQCGSKTLPDQKAQSQSTGVSAFDLPAPAVLRGCRKAPVMFVGINPNLTGYFTLPRFKEETLPKGARAVYPAFANVNDYAQHYRFIQRGVHEYQMADAQVEGLVDAGANGLSMPWSGKIATVEGVPNPSDTQREEQARKAVLALDPDGSDEMKAEPRTWGVQENHVVLRPRFEADKRIAGVMTLASTLGKTLDVSATEGSSYYRNAQAIADAAQLDLGEDISMHDMMACATPKWKADYMGELRAKCVDENQYTARQIRQSRPSLLLFSGAAAFEMFFQTFGAWIVEPVDLAAVRKAVLPGGAGFSSVFTLSMPASEGEADWQVALLVLAHLSYAVAPTQPFSMQSAQWQTFAQNHPEAWGAMVDDETEEAGFVSKATLQKSWRPFIDGLAHEVVQDIEALIEDPRREAVATLVARMKTDGRLRPAASTAPPPGQIRIGSLRRDTQNCNYCAAFAVQGGCSYETPQ